MLPAPASRATGSTSPSPSTASFSGMVRLSPRQEASSPATKSARPVGGHLEPVVASSPGPRAAYAARCSVGDSEWSIGEPRTAQRRAAVSCHSGPGWPGTRPGTPRTICSNSAVVLANLVSPVSRLTVTKYSHLPVLRLRRRLQRRLARRGDRPGRQALVPVGVVAATGCARSFADVVVPVFRFSA